MTVHGLEFFRANEEMMMTHSELQDNRFAVVAEQLIDITSYYDCDDGHDYDVVTVVDADGIHNHSFTFTAADYRAAEILECAVFVDDKKAAHEYMIRWVSERLAKCF